MSRLSKQQYERRTLVVVVLYTVFMLLAWPAVHTVGNVFGKAALALMPAAAMVYLIALMARRVLASDELEQRTHLMALGIATAVIGALSLAGGFLSIAGVWKLDGSILIWVFPTLMLTYSAARWGIQRRYGVTGFCEEAGRPWLPLRFMAAGLAFLLVAALHPRGLDSYQLGFLYGTGAAFAGMGCLFAVVRFYRRRRRHD